MTASPASGTAKTALRNVRIFDGTQLTAPSTVVIDGPVISRDPAGAAHSVDAGGAILLPGLIDAHVHLHGPQSLTELCSYGVTTALDMATWPPQLLASLRNTAGTTDIRSAGTPAIGEGGPHARIPGMARDAIVRTPKEAGEFVAGQVSAGADYIKIVAEAPGEGGPDQDTMNALVAAARTHDRKTVAHAPTSGAFAMALRTGVDFLTHIPLDRPLAPEEVTATLSAGRVVIPTLTMMKGTAAARGAAPAFALATRNVAALHRAGVPILAGTDANTQPGVPFQVPHGVSLHDELELLVDAGLSTVQALRAATSEPARFFGLTDRGAIEPGQRADLILIDGDPLTGIRATRNISRIWCGGQEHTPA
ncbi:amidohydrolase family protein [Streptomyces enissocaesilis]|uniref:Amidohydrolase family protein n=1 Tax=Streptomyces enissocaesilis TaxID=332589 RepID=A0ABN3XNS4_9ACTN